MIGTKLAHYEITSHLGSGGMGDVYQATDAKLGRSVAIKLLPEAFAHDGDRSARFEREARVLASLNHANIAAIYGIEESGGRKFLVMELVPGETLAERIKRGPIPVHEALGIAKEITEGLESAHEKGIIHRDLKPANVKITPDGHVKVLDFGLAKAFAGEMADMNLSNSPTISLAATNAGMILGTAAYMSPEQVKGRAVDRRTDIFAFGCVLYEMLVGRPVFEGEDLQDILGAVLKSDPDWTRLPVEAPQGIRKLLRRCLEKNVKDRHRDAAEVRIAIEEAQKESREVAIPTAIHAKTSRLAWIVAAAAVGGLAVLAFVHFRETAPELQAVQFFIEAPPNTNFGNQYAGFAPSPDGRYVVFAAQAGGGGAALLWLRPLDSTAARPLPGTEGGVFPTWSPDSKSVAFKANGKLKRIEITGGAPLTLGDVTDENAAPVTARGTWNREGVILFGSTAGLQRVSASGGGAALFTRIDPAGKETAHGYPQFLPDGNRFLYFVASGDPNVQGVYAGSLADPGKRQQILRTAAKAAFVPARGASPDYLLWMQEQTLLAQRFDPDALRLEGDPVSVAEEVSLSPTDLTRAAFAASDAGVLTYMSFPTARKRPVVWISRDGKQQGEAAPEDAFVDIALAPGAERMAVARTEIGAGGQGNQDVWVREFARGVMTRLTFDAAVDGLPVWSPDGKEVAFSSTRDGGVNQLFRKDASGAGQEERLTEGPNQKRVVEWSEDGKYLLYWEENPQTRRDVMALPLEGERKPIPVVHTPFNEGPAAISPDGRWVAYASDDSGTYELYVQAFPGVAGSPAGRWQISNGGAYEVKWRGDGKEIYYTSLDGKVMAAAVQGGPQGIRAESPRELFSAGFRTRTYHEFDVTPDGQRFLLILDYPQTEENAQRLTVVSNWQAALRK